MKYVGTPGNKTVIILQNKKNRNKKLHCKGFSESTIQVTSKVIIAYKYRTDKKKMQNGEVKEGV